MGDDIKAQLGATITHRTLTELFAHRGVALDRTYQLNTGGNTDFLNMLESQPARLEEGIEDRGRAVGHRRGAWPTTTSTSGPSDYVAWQNDNKVCFLRMEGRLFGDVPMNLELRLSVEDSPNSAGVAIDVIRCAKLALDRGQGGILHSVSSAFMKHPPVQVPDEEAHRQLDAFIRS